MKTGTIVLLSILGIATVGGIVTGIVLMKKSSALAQAPVVITEQDVHGGLGKILGPFGALFA